MNQLAGFSGDLRPPLGKGRGGRGRTDDSDGLGGGTRTPDFRVPNAARYQSSLHPVNFTRMNSCMAVPTQQLTALQLFEDSFPFPSPKRTETGIFLVRVAVVYIQSRNEEAEPTNYAIPTQVINSTLPCFLSSTKVVGVVASGTNMLLVSVELGWVRFPARALRLFHTTIMERLLLER